jgi:DNA-binding phage protein
VEQICQVSYLSNFETCRILWALQVLGIIRRGQGGEEAIAGEVRAREGEMDLEAVVEKFNQTLNRIHVFLKGRIGDEVDDYMAAALEKVASRYEALFYGIDLRQYGRADYDQMLANVADLPAEERKNLMTDGLRELVAAIQGLVREHQGVEEAAVVTGIIKDGYRRLGVA